MSLSHPVSAKVDFVRCPKKRNLGNLLSAPRSANDRARVEYFFATKLCGRHGQGSSAQEKGHGMLRPRSTAYPTDRERQGRRMGEDISSICGKKSATAARAKRRRYVELSPTFFPPLVFLPLSGPRLSRGGRERRGENAGSHFSS